MYKPRAILNTFSLLRKVFAANFVGFSLLTVGMVIVSLLEGIGLLAIYPVIQIATKSDIAADNPIAEAFATFSSFTGIELTLPNALLILLSIIVTKFVIVFVTTVANGYVFVKIVEHLRLRLFRSVVKAKVSALHERSTGVYANAVGEVSTNYINAMKSAFAIFSRLFQMAVYSSAALLVSWELTVAVLASVTVIALVLFPTGSIIRRSSYQRTEAMNSLTALFVDVLQAIKPLKAMAREVLTITVVGHQLRLYSKAHMNEIVAATIRYHLPEVLLFGAIIGGFYLSTEILNQGLEEIGVLLIIFVRMTSEFNVVLSKIQSVLAFEGSVQLIDEMLEKNESDREHFHKGVAAQFERSIDYKNVQICHSKTIIFDDLSLTLLSNRFYILNGPSGSGKTTLVDSLVGMLKPSSGQILIDGLSLDDIDLRSWREKIGYVPQDPFLFNDSVASNIAMFDNDISEDDIRSALRLAEADAFVDALPDGLQTTAGDRGMRFSGGQRQRLAIARALVRRPRILILDEATSALDPENERAIGETLQRLAENLTIVAITHQNNLRPFASHLLTVTPTGQGSHIAETALAASHGGENERSS